MEPPNVMLGGAEECHSSESGWTMYIGSPIDEDAQCDDDDNLDYDYGGTHADPEAESDDSMASDASSGPSHYGIINPLGNNVYDGFTHFQRKDEEDHKRATKSQKSENQVGEKSVEKNEIVFVSGKGKAPEIQKGGKDKVRKNHGVGITRK